MNVGLWRVRQRRAGAVGALLALGVVLVGLWLASGSRGLAADPAPAPKAKWSVFVYMLADNDLEPHGVDDLLEMAAVGSGPNVNLIAQAGRGGEEDDRDVLAIKAWSGVKRLRIEKDKVVELADLGETDMASPRTLAEFIAWAGKTYPAERVALVLWDHGGGWSSFGEDATHETSFDLPGLKTGLKTGLASAGLRQLDLLGYDACLMATLETAMAMRPFAKYMLASAELEPGHGWDYRALKVLHGPDEVTVPQLARAVMGGYTRQAAAEKEDAEITLSLLNLSALEPLDAALKELGPTVVDLDLPRVAPAIGRTQTKTLKFGDSPDPEDSSHLIDLGQFATRLSATDPKLAAVAQRINTALKGVVEAQVAGKARKGSTGLSVYFPLYEKYYDPAYDQLDDAQTWRRFIKTYYTARAAIKNKPDFAAAQDQHEVTVAKDGSFAVKARLDPESDNNVVEATLYFGYRTKDGDVFVGDQPADLADDGEVSGQWDGSVIVLRQGKLEELAYLSVSTDDEGYSTASVPLEYVRKPGRKPQNATLELVFDPQDKLVSETYYVETAGGMGELKPRPGSVLRAVLMTTDADGEADWEPGEVEFNGAKPIEVSVEKLPKDLELLIELEATDVAGNTDSVQFSNKE